MTLVFALAAAFLAGVSAVLAVAFASMHRRHHLRFELPESASVPGDLASLAGLAQGELTSGNRVSLVEDGAYLAASLGLIRSARRTLHFETFLWKTGEMSAAIAGALSERARAGVEVRLLLDAFGSRALEDGEARSLERAGVELHRVRPAGLRHLGRLNNRTHRKILVADGRRAIVGGHCVDDRWIGGDGQTPEVRDVSVEVEGPVVRSIQSAFCEGWIQVSASVPFGDGVFPPLEPVGSARAHLAHVRPSGGVATVKLLHHLALRVARERLWIQSPYFVPDDGARRALLDAASRGVDVRVLMPGMRATDNRLVAHASQYRLAPLLEGGVSVFHYHRTLLHQKVWSVDGEYVLVGSTNFDERSFDLDDQVTLALADRSVAKRIDARFLEDLRYATAVEARAWKTRPLRQKLGDALAFALREQL